MQKSEAEIATEKYGLEAGLFKVGLAPTRLWLQPPFDARGASDVAWLLQHEGRSGSYGPDSSVIASAFVAVLHVSCCCLLQLVGRSRVGRHAVFLRTHGRFATAQAFSSKNSNGKSSGEQAKELLKQYGSAYLITSISFAIVSFSACYGLVNAGRSIEYLCWTIVTYWKCLGVPRCMHNESRVLH